MRGVASSRSSISTCFIMVLTWFCVVGAAPAQTGSDWAEGAVARARLVDGGPEGDGARRVVLEISLPPGWKTYWRWPGETGLPTEVDWSASDNLAGVETIWPAPAAFESFGLRSYGYERHAALALTARAVDASAPMRLSGELTLGVCDDICVLDRISLSQTLSTAPAPEAGAALWRSAAESALRPALAEGFEVTSCAVRPEETGGEYAIELTVPAAYAAAQAAPAPPDGGWLEETEIERDGARVRVSGRYRSDRALTPGEGVSVAFLRDGGVGGAVLRGCGD